MAEKFYFIKDGNPTGQAYTPADLAEMIFQKKIRGHRTVTNASGNATGSADGVVGIAYANLQDKCISVRQRAYLRFLGYEGTLYISQKKASILIDTLKKAPENMGQHAKGRNLNEYEKEAASENEEYKLEVLCRQYRGRGLSFSGLAKQGELKHLITKTQEYNAPFREAEQARQAQEEAERKRIKQQQWEEWKKTRLPEHKERIVEAGKTAVTVASTVGGFLGKWIGKGAKAGTAMLADSLCLEQEQPIRTWTSVDGKHTIEGRLVGVSESAVRLQKADGSLTDVQKSQLCQDDLDWLNGIK